MAFLPLRHTEDRPKALRTMERHTKNVNSCLNTNIYSYLEASGGQSSYLHLDVVHFFNTSINWTSVSA
jgi:hypothetical protein